MTADIDYEKIRDIIREELTPVWAKLDRHDEKIAACEKYDAAHAAVEKKGSDNTALAIAICAIIISAISTIANLLGG